MFNKFADYQTKLTNPLTKSDVIDNVTSTTTNVPLSANQGKYLKDLIDGLTTRVETLESKIGYPIAPPSNNNNNE